MSLRREMRPLAILATMFVLLSGGPYGLEEVVPRAGPGLALLVLTLMGVVWAVPYALVVAELVSVLPAEGGIYQWFRASLGPFWAFQLSVLDWITWVLEAALYPPLVAAYFAGLFVQHPGRWLSWGIGLAMIWGCTWLNIRGVKAVGWSSVAISLVVLAPLAGIIVLGFSRIHLATLSPWIPEGQSFPTALNYALIWSLWSYSGYGALASASEEMVRPERTYPRALAIFLPLCLATYVLPLLVALGVSPAWRQWDTGQFNEVALRLGGAGLLACSVVAVQVSSLGQFNSELLVISRVPYAMARDRLLPPFLAKLHPRYGTPARILVLAAILFSLLTLFFDFVQLLVAGTWLALPTYLMTFACPIVLRWRNPEARGPFRIPGGWPVLLGITLVPAMIALYVLVTVETRHLLLGLSFIAAIPVIYVLSRRQNRGQGL
ncbi:MAG TPA: APC family permease [Candidatus Polarisedimenticolia bacterium]|nr:APC family permease [Candidatus Polarisedimenticolia bacterium]